MSRYVFDNPETVYDMTNQIQDRESRLFAVAHVVRAHNDYSRPCVLKAYIETKQENAIYIDHLLLDAIQSNLKFALDETGKLLLNYFVPVPGESNSLNGGRLDSYFMSKCYVRNIPRRFLNYCIAVFVRRSVKQSGLVFMVIRQRVYSLAWELRIILKNC